VDLWEVYSNNSDHTNVDLPYQRFSMFYDSIQARNSKSLFPVSNKSVHAL